jgi:hypothetical protein
VLNTAGTPSSYAGTIGAPANQCLVSINSSGVGTWAQIGTAFLDFDPATQAELNAHEADTTAVHGIANTANLVLKDGSVTMDKLALFDRDATPVANRQLGVTDGRIKAETTGGVEGRYISKDSIEPLDAAALASDSVTSAKVAFNYVGQLTAGSNITLTNCTPGEGVNCTIAAPAAGGGTAATTTFAPTGTIAGADVQTAVAEVAAEAEQVSRKSLPGAIVANGYLGASSTGRVPWASAGDFAQHGNLSIATTITPTAPTMGIQSAGGALISTATTQIAPGTYHGQRLTTKGTSATDTFQLNNGNGIRLCGNTGSVVLGLNLDKVEWDWNSVLNIWEEMGCKGLDRIANVGRKITTATSEAAAFEVGSLTDFYRIFAEGGKAIMKCVSGGGACDTEFTVPATKLGKFFSGTDELVRITESTDTWEFLMGTLVLNNNVAFTLNAEQANKTVQLPRPLWRPAAGCNGSTAAPIWDLPASAAAVAACVTGTNTQKGVLDFVDASTTTAQLTERLSSAWTGDIGVVLTWFSGTGSTNSVVWRVRASCVADGETDDPAWDPDVLQITDAGKGTANQTNNATGTLLAASHLSTCAAGELLHLEVGRLGADGADTHAATARLIGVEFLVREAW